jgi:hypothetical protein
MFTGLDVQYPLSCQILIKLEFSRHIFKKNAEISNFVKIRADGTELYHADRQT